MARDPIHHPIQHAIEDIWKAGHTPRVQVDARRDDVTVPESVKARWGARLVLDLDAAWPLNLTYDAKGIAVDLAFQGHVTRCELPWESIYVVLDRATGRGVVIESHLPKDEGADADAGMRPTPVQPAPRAVRSEPQQPEEPAAGEAPTGDVSSDEEAKRRRARFKVIDGGR